MFGFFKKKRVVVEHIGPDAPKVKIAGSVHAYSMDGGALTMTISMRDQDALKIPVPASVQSLFPVGSGLWLVVEKKS